MRHNEISSRSPLFSKKKIGELMSENIESEEKRVREIGGRQDSDVENRGVLQGQKLEFQRENSNPQSLRTKS